MKKLWLTMMLAVVLCLGSWAGAEVKDVPASMPIPEILPSNLSKAGWNVQELLDSIPMSMETEFVNGWPVFKDQGFSAVQMTLFENGDYVESLDFLLVDGYWQLPFCDTSITSWVALSNEQVLYIDLSSGAHLGYYNGAFMQWQTADYKVWLTGGAYQPKDAAIWDKWVFHVSSPRTDFSYDARYNKSGSMINYTCNARARYDANNKLLDFTHYADGIEYRWSPSNGWINAQNGQAVECPIDDFSIDFVYECYPPQVKTIQVPGDSDGSGGVNINDVIALLLHLAGKGNGINLTNSNVTGDGKVDTQDVLRIMQHIAGWGVTLQ